MDFELTSEHKAIMKMVSDFAQEEIFPKAAQWDEEHYFPKDVYKKAAELGLAGLYVREDVGGTGLKRLDAALVFETIARACATTSAYLSIHNMVSSLIDTYGNEKQRKKWLPELVKMNLFSSYCLTEPEAGSDAASLKTQAVREGNHYIVNGSKSFISGGGVSDIYLCMVRTSDEGAKGITCLLVEKDTKGLSFGKQEKKLGWHSQPTSMVFFENCKIPVENRIGEEGQGFSQALSALNGGRINIAACSLGGAFQTFTLAKKYLQERKQFGKTLENFQALQFRLADMYTELEAARLMTYRAACAMDAKSNDTPLYCAMAKRFATDVGYKIADEAMQLFGGYGYLKDYPIERYCRDLRVHKILEGTNEVMRVIIAKRLLSDDTYLEQV